MIISHPGHELRIYGWLQTHRPKIYVLTDGSGRSHISRLASTTRILKRLNIPQGSVYGGFSDADFYSAMLHHDFDLFIGLAKKISQELSKEPVDLMLGDAEEGFNPSHDVCRILINACVKILSRKKNLTVKNFDFALTGKSDDCPKNLRDQAIWLRLDAQTLKEKMKTARAYKELSGESDIKKIKQDPRAFSTECLRPLGENAYRRRPLKNAPYYESYGRKKVAAGHYQKVIRYREHVLPIAQALEKYVDGAA